MKENLLYMLALQYESDVMNENVYVYVIELICTFIFVAVM